MVSATYCFRRLSLCVYVAIACCSCASKLTAPPRTPHQFLAPHGANFINDAYAHPDVWDGAGIATQARVRLIRPTPKGQAILEMEVESPETVIWAVWPIKWMDDFVASGDVVRIAGWLRRTEDWNKATHSVPNDNPLTLLAICM